MSSASSEALIHLSAALGAAPTRIQGPGGNTSEKCDGVLWIKASGTWLADAKSCPIFVAADLAAIRSGLDRGRDTGVDAILSDLSPPGLRPSIETALHALMPHTVVVHTHSVDVIAQAVRRDGARVCAERLSGLRWAWVPYATPGLPLAQAVRSVLAQKPDILVLANHGVVIGADDHDAAQALLDLVETRLSCVPKNSADASVAVLAEIAEGTGWALPKFAEAHQLAFVPAAARTCAGALYPDHVVFLGPGSVPYMPPLLLRPFLAKSHDRFPVMAVAAGAGVLVRGDASDAAQEMVRCLAMIAVRLDSDAQPVYLTPEQEAELLGMDAEVARQSLDRARRL